MSKEQVKEVIERIGYQEFYRYYEEKDTLIELQKQEIERLHSIIKEVREYIESYLPNYDFDKTNLKKLLEILKGSDKE